MSDVVCYRVSENRLNRLREHAKATRRELYNKVDLLNKLYAIVFPDYVPEVLLCARCRLAVTLQTTDSTPTH